MRANIAVRSPAEHGRRPLAEHAVEFVDQQCHRTVRITGRDRSTKVRPRNLDVALGREHPGTAARTAFHIDAHAQDSRLVPDETFGLGFEYTLHGVGQFEMNAAQDQFRMEFRRWNRSHGDFQH